METIFQAIDHIKENIDNPEVVESLKHIEDELHLLKTKQGLRHFAKSNDISKALKNAKYEQELIMLQIELVKLQNWVTETNSRVMILFEGRDAAGKGGAIKRFTNSLNPRSYRVVALPKPSDIEKGQFYFQRYMKELPNPGEIVFFDRSWYNRAVVEPVFNFCSQEQYDRFMLEVPEIEHALIDDGIIVIKFWFSISKESQLARFEERTHNPLKQWKLSPVDLQAQQMWDKVTYYKEEMFSRTHTGYSPWIIVNSNNKKKARLESIRYVLSTIPYTGKEKAKSTLHPNPEIVSRYHRRNRQIDS
jgi:polyphosphate kinase 2